MGATAASKADGRVSSPLEFDSSALRQNAEGARADTRARNGRIPEIGGRAATQSTRVGKSSTAGGSKAIAVPGLGAVALPTADVLPRWSAGVEFLTDKREKRRTLMSTPRISGILGSNTPRTRAEINRLDNSPSTLKPVMTAAGGDQCRHVWLPAPDR